MNTTQFSSPQNLLDIPGPTGKLAAIISPPPSAGAPVIAIICHPHPLHGGTMQNKVISTLARSFYDLGIWSIRFNFRGVGASEGSYDNGRGEAEDLLAVAKWAQQEFPAYTLWLAGFSFGAYIAMQGACHPALASHVKQLITIAPAVNHFVFPASAHIQSPWLLIMGEQDEIVPVTAVKNWLKTQSSAIETIYFPEAGHFFHGHLVTLREQLKTALQAKAS
jgi:alpha/beta superfamily hydrolase